MRAARGLDSRAVLLSRVGSSSNVSRETSAQCLELDATAVSAEPDTAVAEPPNAVRIERLVVRKDRVRATVRVVPFACMTTPRLAARVMQEFPLIEHHACVNEKGNTFGLVIDHTPLPHLMEHLVIALQMRAELQPASGNFTYVGTSEWTNEAAGEALIEVNFIDDLVALRAFRDAGEFLNEAVGAYRVRQ